MDAHRFGGARRGGRVRPAVSSEEAEAQFRLALAWRDAWRAEKAAALAPQAGGEAPRSGEQTSDDVRRRARFASALARAEFGKAYWDERRQADAPAGRRPSRRV